MDNKDNELQEEREKISEEFAGLLKDNQDPKNYFKKKKYDEYFENFCQQNEYIFEDILECWDGIAKSVEDDILSERADLLHNLACSIAEAAKDDVESLKGLNKGNRQGELNLFMVTSVFPCILKLGESYGEELCKEIVKEWERVFPGTELGYADFDKLKSGFKSFWGFLTGR